MRNKFRDELSYFVEKNNKINLIVSDIGYGVFEDYQKKYCNNFYNLGISEANIIGFSAGMSKMGFLPIVYTIVPFLVMRPYEQIRVDLCISKNKAILVGVGGGLSYGSLGPTHHSYEDVGMMLALPNMNVYTPAEPSDINMVLKECIDSSSSSYIRLGKNGEKNSEVPKIKNFASNSFFLYGDINSNNVYISYGPLCNELLNKIDSETSDYLFIRILKIKPFDYSFLNLINSNKTIIFIEEHFKANGVGNLVASYMLENKIVPLKFVQLGLEDKFIDEVGSREFLLESTEMISKFA